jgi:predicted ATPase
VTENVEYIFKHALTQEVAYNALLVERRKILHERTAAALESMFIEQMDDHLNELAYHYGRSDNVEKTVKYLWRSGQLAILRSANAEAISQLTTALELLKVLADSSER